MSSPVFEMSVQGPVLLFALSAQQGAADLGRSRVDLAHEPQQYAPRIL
jgi:hypothetical protein